MDEQQLASRLSQLSTCWTLLGQAHAGAGDLEARAQAALLERYQAAVYRYLLALLRDPDAADEVFQEFALGVVRGNFRHADPGRGRFRQYVKTSLIHLANAYRKRQARHQLAPLEEPAAPAAAEDHGDDAPFIDGWRKALLDRAWEALAGVQKPGGPPVHDALRLKTEQPNLTSDELAGRLNQTLRLRMPLSSAGLRKLLQRARDLFTDFLVDEIARSLRTDDLHVLEQELIDLGFHAHCRRALDRRRQAT